MTRRNVLNHRTWRIAGDTTLSSYTITDMKREQRRRAREERS